MSNVEITLDLVKLDFKLLKMKLCVYTGYKIIIQLNRTLFFKNISLVLLK